MVDVRCETTTAILPDESVYRSAFAALPEWRRRKAVSFRFAADRRRSVAAWLLLRRMLAERGIDADALAVSDAEVGCDVERIMRFDDGMLKLSLVDAERIRLAALSGAARDREFIRLWVRKESYVKAVGEGMDIGLSTFSALDTPPSSDWVWQVFDFGDGHLGCVCSRLSSPP